MIERVFYRKGLIVFLGRSYDWLVGIFEHSRVRYKEIFHLYDCLLVLHRLRSKREKMLFVGEMLLRLPPLRRYRMILTPVVSEIE